MGETFTTEPANIPLSILLRERYGISQAEANRLRDILRKKGLTPRQIRSLNIPSEALPEKYKGREQVTEHLISLLEAEQPSKEVYLKTYPEGTYTTKEGQTFTITKKEKSSYPEIERIRSKTEAQKQTVMIAVDYKAIQEMNKALPPGELQRQLKTGEATIKEGQIYYTTPTTETPGISKEPTPPLTEKERTPYYGWEEYFTKTGAKGILETKKGFEARFKPVPGMEGQFTLTQTEKPDFRLITGPAKTIYGVTGAIGSAIIEPVIWTLFAKRTYEKGIPEEDLWTNIKYETPEGIKETPKYKYIIEKETAQTIAGGIQLSFLTEMIRPFARPTPITETAWYEKDVTEAWAKMEKAQEPYKLPSGKGIILPDESFGLAKPTEIQSQLIEPKITIELMKTDIKPQLETYLPEQHIKLAIQKEALSREPLKVSIFAPEEYTPMDFLELARQRPDLAKSFMEETGQTALTKDYFNKISTQKKLPANQRLKSVLEEIQTELAKKEAKIRADLTKKEVALEQIKPTSTQLKLVEVAPEVFKPEPSTIEIEPAYIELEGKRFLILGKKGEADIGAIFSKFKKEKLNPFSKIGESLTKANLGKMSEFSSVFSEPKPPPYEEVYIPVATLPYWEKIEPIQNLLKKEIRIEGLKDATGIKTTLKTDIYYSTQIGLKELQRLGQTQIQRLGQTQIQSQEQIQKQIQTQIQRLGQTQAQRLEQIQKQIQATGLGQAQIQSQEQITEQIQEQIQEQKQTQTPTLKPITFKPLEPLRPPRPTETQKPPPPPTILKKPELPKTKNIFTQGYDVFVRQAGKFKKINLGALSKPEAIKLGSSIVEETARASFKIEPSTSPITQRFKSLGPSLSRFYKKQGVYIEKPRFRISTPGELREITFKGILARKSGKTKKKKKTLFKNIFGDMNL